MDEKKNSESSSGSSTEEKHTMTYEEAFITAQNMMCSLWKILSEAQDIKDRQEGKALSNEKKFERDMKMLREMFGDLFETLNTLEKAVQRAKAFDILNDEFPMYYHDDEKKGITRMLYMNCKPLGILKKSEAKVFEGILGNAKYDEWPKGIEKYLPAVNRELEEMRKKRDENRRKEKAKE